MVVISISLSGRELADFDHLVEHHGYDSRSSAVRDALHKYVAQHRFEFSEGEMDVVITMAYPDTGPQEKVRGIVHEHDDLVVTNIHHHGGPTCVDVMVVHGLGPQIHALVDALSSVRDVRVTITPVGQHGGSPRRRSKAPSL
jgi:CopG family transcriptional regulator, nickel-responsive regulator